MESVKEYVLIFNVIFYTNLKIIIPIGQKVHIHTYSQLGFSCES